MRQRAVRGDQVQPGGLACAGFAAEQHVAFGQVDVDVLAVFVLAQVHRVEHGERERGHRWPAAGCQWWSWRVPPFEAVGVGRAVPRACRGTAAPGYAAGPCSSPGRSATRARAGWCW